MASSCKQNLKSILHPYLFVLKEGGTIKNDFLDYSLMMLHITSSETIKSPQHLGKPFPEIFPEIDFLNSISPAFLGKNSN